MRGKCSLLSPAFSAALTPRGRSKSSARGFLRYFPQEQDQSPDPCVSRRTGPWWPDLMASVRGDRFAANEQETRPGKLTIWGLSQASLHKLMFSWQECERALQIQDVTFASLFLCTRDDSQCIFSFFSYGKSSVASAPEVKGRSKTNTEAQGWLPNLPESLQPFARGSGRSL